MKGLRLMLALLGVTTCLGTVMETDVQKASGVAYVGKGYNIINANPDGVGLGGAPPVSATDPGIIAHQLLSLTYDTRRTDPEGRFMVPDQLNYSPENNCFNMTSNKVIFGQKSYQEKLMASVDAGGSVGAGLMKFAFSAGMGTDQEKSTDASSQKVYFDETVICTYATVMYRFGNDPKYQLLSSDMRREICKLPKIKDESYYALFDEYGTHFIHGAVLGSRNIRRKETIMTTFMEKILDQKTANADASASYLGIGGKIDLSMESTSLGKNTENAFTGNELSWTVGSKVDNKPTKISISSIDELMDPDGDFWYDHCIEAREGTDKAMIDCCDKLQNIYGNMDEALKDYPTYWRKVKLPTDPSLQFELVWPAGTYILPRPSAGCPNGTGFQWAYGMIHQDTPDWRDDNKWSENIHWDEDQLDSSSITQKYCVKGIDKANKNELKWPRGSYCIIKYRTCSAGFTEGWIRFDDESTFNRNRHFGSFPSGEFESGKTKIEYCCRNDGSALQNILLPNTKPFYMLQSGTECQNVESMNVHAEFVQWSRERWGGLTDREMVGGKMPPYHRLDKALRIFYCFYSPKTVNNGGI